MSHLLKKSEDNFKAAECLRAEALFATSIHCAYYRCLQYMLHLKQTRKDIPQLAKGKDSHNLLINEFLLALAPSGVASTFNDDINMLKKMRVRADYRNSQIVKEKSDEAMELSNGVMNLLLNIFK